MNILDSEIWLRGSSEPAAPARSLRAGCLQVDYQDGFLRYLRRSRHEVLRMVNFALRDQNWGTVPFHIEDEEVEQQDDRFRIRYRAVFDSDGIRFAFACHIEGDPDGSVRFAIDGHAHSAFLKNRAGFTVLHPLRECVGQPLTVRHSDGSIERSHFPDRISPHQPARDIRQMTWSLPDGGEAKLSFEGDIFEMEDQRNWTDASFKTYCTPLDQPFPVALSPGDRVQQSLTLRLVGPSPQAKPELNTVITLQSSSDWVAFPSVGVAASSQTESLSDEQIARLKALQLGHYRVELCLDHDDWTALWQREAKHAARLSLPIDLALHVPGETRKPEEVVRALQASTAPVRTITLYQLGAKVTPSALVERFAPVLRSQLQKVQIGAGTDAFFAELNRERPETDSIDFLSYSLNPQVHASDPLSLIETLEAQPATVATAQDFAAGRAIHVAPITLKMRWNPNATGPEPERPAEALPADVDPRQMSFLAATWAIGTLKQLAQSGARSLTLFETVGEKGLMNHASPLRPDRFPAPPGSLYPVYSALSLLAGARQLRPVTSSAPLSVDGLWIRGGEDRLLLVNYSDRAQTVQLPAPFHSGFLWTFSSDAYPPDPGKPGASFSGDKLPLKPYSFACITCL